MLIAIAMYMLASLFLVYEMGVQVSPSVMTKDLIRDFHINFSVLGWMASAYFYSYTLMQVPVGLLYDRFGPRTLLSAAALICSLGAFFFASTHSVFWAAIGRIFMGFGSACAFTGVLLVAARWFDGYYFALLVGGAQMLAAFGAIAGQIPMAALVNAYGWRSTMYGLGWIGAILAIVNVIILRDRPKHESTDVEFRETSFWKHFTSILKNPQSWFIGLYAFTGWGPMAVFASLWGVPFLEVKFGISNVVAATSIMMMWLGIAFCSPFVGIFSNIIGRRKPILWIGSCLGIIASCCILYIPDLSLGLTYILLLCLGIACSVHILTFALVRDNQPKTRVATGIGFNNCAVVFSGAILQPLVGYVLHALSTGKETSAGIPWHSTAEYQSALVVLPILYAVGALVSFFCIKETFCQHVTKRD